MVSELQILSLYRSIMTCELFPFQISRSDLIALLVDFFLRFKFQSWISRPIFKMKILAHV